MVRTVSMTVAILVAPSMVQAYAKYVELVPNGGNVPDTPNIGHLDPAGETGVSVFGQAFSTAGNAWGPVLCQADADGDGFTNGQELGDPCCTWVTGSTAGLVTDGISDPSDASKTPSNAELQAGCATGGSSISANFSGSGTASDVVGTVLPAPSSAGGLPPDDDEDDSSESAVIMAGASLATTSRVVMGVATVIAAANLL